MLGTHQLLAAWSRNSIWMIEPQEAEQIARAIIKVKEQYPDLPLLSPRATAWLGLLATIGSIHGPRIGYLIMQRQEAKRQAAAQRQHRAQPHARPDPQYAESTDVPEPPMDGMNFEFQQPPVV